MIEEFGSVILQTFSCLQDWNELA